MTDPEAIAAQVAAAFPPTPVPPHEALFKDHCPECVEVSNAFGHRPWPDISPQDLAGRETALLSATAWRYYLPAVITSCVRDPGALDVLCDNLVYQLEPPAPGKDDEWFAERSGSFTHQQRQAIVAYLSWYRERQEAEYAELAMDPPQHVYRALEHWGADAS